VECGARLERANTGMILMAQICRSACVGLSGTTPVVKKKHMTQAVCYIVFLVSLQTGRSDRGPQVQLINRLSQNVHFCPSPLLCWSFWSGSSGYDRSYHLGGQMCDTEAWAWSTALTTKSHQIPVVSVPDIDQAIINMGKIPGRNS
jgi:hypothetical protein